MADTVALDRTTPPSQPSGGIEYLPLPDSDKNGLVTAHALQTINADPETLYNLWHDVTRFPRWQEHVISVTPTGPASSHWIMGNPEDPEATRVEFDSEIVEDVPARKIAWKSIGGAVEQAGAVTFETSISGRGTLVTLLQTIKVPGGAIGNAAAAIVKRSPKQTVIENLRHFKQLAEAGEIPSVTGQPHGPRGITGGLKEWLYGETNPTPPGTSDKA